MRILIAEDDPAFRQILEEILVRWGYETVIARDGNEAWQALQAMDAPRLAILDWKMPGMDGLEICRQVRKEAKGHYIYIILLTSQQRDEDLVTGMEAGADDYLTKPLKTNELRVRLNAGRRMVELQNELSFRALDLEAANRDLESFSYTVANDLLRSLLTIGKYAKSIQDKYCSSQDEQCRTYTHRIYETTKQLGQLVDIMHEYFRPTRIELQRKMIGLDVLAKEAADKLRRTKPDRRVTFRIAEGIMVYGDKNLLGTALENLLDNAWKHTAGREEAIIEFGMTEVDGKPTYFVRDNGTGFRMEHADKLFRPFQRLPGAEEFAGKGVGLATVERIIRRHGGKVWADGKPDHGATFYFTL